MRLITSPLPAWSAAGSENVTSPDRFAAEAVAGAAVGEFALELVGAAAGGVVDAAVGGGAAEVDPGGGAEAGAAQAAKTEPTTTRPQPRRKDRRDAKTGLEDGMTAPTAEIVTDF